MAKPPTKYYPPAEERINILSHAFGFLLSLVALALLLMHSINHGTAWHVISFAVYGLSLTIMYAASTAYHATKDPDRRNFYKVCDHAAIYVFIAGTYTPFALITLAGKTGWAIFGVSWVLAVTGIILKLFFTGRYSFLSTSMYVAMGWMILFAIKPLIASLPAAGLYWLVAGGVLYTVGAIVYGIHAIKFNHAIFHLLVVLASLCHFISVYFYVLPH